jgi:hypothetical protein
VKSAEELSWIEARRPGKAFIAFMFIFTILCLIGMVVIVA